MVAAGYEHYNEMCAVCTAARLAPHRNRSGLYPPAPDLAEEAADLSPAELFWITKYGIKMTGMPASSRPTPTPELWAIVALVHACPGSPPRTSRPSPAGRRASLARHQADGHRLAAPRPAPSPRYPVASNKIPTRALDAARTILIL